MAAQLAWPANQRAGRYGHPAGCRLADKALMKETPVHRAHLTSQFVEFAAVEVVESGCSVEPGSQLLSLLDPTRNAADEK